MVLQPNGEIAVAAATSARSSVVEDIFATLLRVRQAEFASWDHAEEPDAWSTGVAEPGVCIDIHTSLSDKIFESAWRSLQPRGKQRRK